MARRAESTHVPAEPEALPPKPRVTLARGLPSPGAPSRAFRILHQPGPPFEWLLRLEASGGDRLWLLPRGLPWAQDEARTATPAPPDASLAGAEAWDEGRYRVLGLDDRAVVLELEGRRILGRHALQHEGPGRYALRRLDPASLRPMPEHFLPMLAHAAGYPTDEDAYAFEIKWDGIRALAHVSNGRVLVRSRTLNDITAQYPELQGLAHALDGRRAILDGEIIAPDETGRPDFQRLQGRLGVAARGLAQRKAEEIPIVYMAFDVLYLDGHDLTALPYEERRAALESLNLHGPAWRVSPAVLGRGRSLLAMPGWEGVVAKRLGSPYEPGARSRAWLKVKLQRRQELVIGGWSAGRGARKGRIGALLVGHYDMPPAEARERGAEPRLLYAGSVGTGFSGCMLDDLRRLLDPLRRETSPFSGSVDKKDVVFVEPRHVAEFEFTEWTREGRMRHPSFKGLREDKDPREVVREEG